MLTRCEGCQKEIQGLRSSITQCKCGFDFRQSSCLAASKYQVNLARYLYSLEGDDFCRHSLEKIYGRDHPILEINLAQFTWLLHALSREIQFYMGRLRIFSDAQVPDLIKQSYSVSWGTFVFYLFKSWRRNFTQLFRWFEQQLFLGESEESALKIITKFLSSLVYYLPDKWKFSEYVSQYILDLLKRHKISQIEIICFDPEAVVSKVGSLSNLSQFLNELSAEFKIPNLTLACLLHSSVYLYYCLPDSGLPGTVGCYFPWILKLNDPTFPPFFRTMYPSQFKL